MSYCANIRTLTKIEPQSLFKALADAGEQIVVTSSEFPCLHFGTFKYALRGVEVNQEEDGYEVRAFSMSSMADYQLFPKVVCAIQELTGGDVYDEDSDKPLKYPKKRFGLKWRREQTEGSWNITCALIKNSDEPIIMNGLFAPFIIGKGLLNAYSIDLDNPTGGEDYKRLGYFLFSNQWAVKDMTSTASQLAISSPKNKKQKLSLSMISLKNGKVCDFEYVSYADLICIMNQDNNDMALARFKYLAHILPLDKFRHIDEWQYVLKEPLTKEDFDDMLADTKVYQEDDFFAESSWSGVCFKGDVQYLSESGHQLAIPSEFKKTKENAQIEGQKAPEYIIWSNDFALFFDVHPCLLNETIADKESSIRDFREQTSDKYGLIEIEEGHTKAGNHFCYNLMKAHEENGVIYQLTMLVQADSDVMVIACAGIEEGVTGQREAIVFELERRKNNVRFEDDSIVGWNKDPYDENIKTGFLMNLAEQAEYDSMFPSHPLSQLRELVRFIVEKN